MNRLQFPNIQHTLGLAGPLTNPEDLACEYLRHDSYTYAISRPRLISATMSPIALTLSVVQPFCDAGAQFSSAAYPLIMTDFDRNREPGSQAS